MTIEVATTINQLDHNLPDFQDFVSEGDDHIRLVKSSLKNTWHNVLGVVDASHTEINRLVGVTSSVIDTAKLAALPAAVGTTTPVAGTWTDLTSTAKFRATNNGTVGLATDLHAGQFGPTSGLNIAVGNGVIQGRNNGALAALLANSLGGQVALGGSDVSSTVDLKNVRTRVMANSALALQIQNQLDGAPAINAAIDLNVGLYSSAGLRRAFLGFSASKDFVLQNDHSAGVVSLRGMNGAAALRTMGDFTPGGAVTLYYDAVARLATNGVGAFVNGLFATDQFSTLGSGANNVSGVWTWGATGCIIARVESYASLGLNMGLQVGPTSGVNLGFSEGEIQGRNNGVVSTVVLNRAGGDVRMGRDSGGSAIWSDANKTLFLENGANLYVGGVVTVVGSAASTFIGAVNAGDLMRQGIKAVDENRAINTALGLQGGGFLNADRTIDFALANLGAVSSLAPNDIFLVRNASNVHQRADFWQIKRYLPVARTSDVTLTDADAFTEQLWNSTGPGTITLPSSSAFSGCRIRFRKFNTGNLTIAGYNVKKGSYDTITLQGGMAEAVFEGGVWILSGDLGASLDNRYESSGVTVTTSGSFTHGLGAKPDGFEIVLQCTSAILGYAVGDEVKLESCYTGGGNPTLWANATQIGWAMNNATPSLFQKGTNTTGAVSSGWSVVGRAWRYRT